MIERFGTNPTQLAGLLAFALTALACLAASGARRKSRDPSIWRGLSLIYGLFTIEMIVAMRHKIHNLVNAQLQATGDYAARAGLQDGLIALLAIVIITVMGVYFLRLRRVKPVTRTAVAVTIGLTALFLVEMISLHAIDALLYRPIGPLMLIAWLWIAAAALTILCALRYRRRR